jgi:hypothetical protein
MQVSRGYARTTSYKRLEFTPIATTVRTQGGICRRCGGEDESVDKRLKTLTEGGRGLKESGAINSRGLAGRLNRQAAPYLGVSAEADFSLTLGVRHPGCSDCDGRLFWLP